MTKIRVEIEIEVNSVDPETYPLPESQYGEKDLNASENEIWMMDLSDALEEMLYSDDVIDIRFIRVKVLPLGPTLAAPPPPPPQPEVPFKRGS